MARKARAECLRARAFPGEEMRIVYTFILSRTKWKWVVAKRRELYYQDGDNLENEERADLSEVGSYVFSCEIPEE